MLIKPDPNPPVISGDLRTPPRLPRRLPSVLLAGFRRLCCRVLRRCCYYVTETERCDGCNGNFFLADHTIHPVSGDAWLCTECLDRYLHPR